MNRKFSSDVLKLVTGPAINQIIGLISVPIISRLYSPADFGMASFIASLVAIVVAVASLRYEETIVLQKSDKNAHNTLTICSISITILCIVVFILLMLEQKYKLINSLVLQTKTITLLIPITIFITAHTRFITNYHTKNQNYSIQSVSKILTTITTTCSVILFGVNGIASGLDLIMSNLFGQTVGFLVVLWFFVWKTKMQIVKDTRYKSIKKLLKRYKHFAKYGTIAALVNTCSWQLPVIFFASYFSDTIAGYYSFGFRIIQLPMNLIGLAIGQVLLRNGVDAEKSGQLGELVKNVSLKLVTLTAMPIVVLLLFGSDLFVLFFGAKWSEAGFYVQILSPWALVWFIATPISNVLFILEKQKEDMIFQIVLLIMRSFALIIGCLAHNAIISVILYSFVGVVFYLYLFLYCCRISKVHVSDLLNKLAKLIICITMLLTGLFYLYISKIVSLNIIIILSLILYINFLYTFRSNFKTRDET